MKTLIMTAALIALTASGAGVAAEARGELYGWGIGHNMQNKDEKAYVESIYARSIKGFDLVKTEHIDPASIYLMLGTTAGCLDNSEEQCKVGYMSDWQIKFPRSCAIDWSYYVENYYSRLQPTVNKAKIITALSKLDPACKK